MVLSRKDKVEQRYKDEKPSIQEITKSHEQTLIFLESYNLIPTKQIKCINKDCMLLMDRKKNNQKADGIWYFCTKCKKSRSLRCGSIFHKSKLSLMEATRIIFYYYLKRKSIQETSMALNINSNSVSFLYDKVNDTLSAEIIANQVDHKLGVIPMEIPREITYQSLSEIFSREVNSMEVGDEPNIDSYKGHNNIGRYQAHTSIDNTKEYSNIGSNKEHIDFYNNSKEHACIDNKKNYTGIGGNKEYGINDYVETNLGINNKDISIYGDSNKSTMIDDTSLSSKRDNIIIEDLPQIIYIPNDNNNKMIIENKSQEIIDQKDFLEIPIVDIDEALYAKLVDDNGNKSQVWVLAIIDRCSMESRAFIVPNRTSQSLMSIILENVEKGARIYTDGWAAYSKLKDLGYDHRVINIKPGNNNQSYEKNHHIENFWNELKDMPKFLQGVNIHASYKTKIEQLQLWINVQIWFLNHRNDEDLVEALAHTIANTYIIKN